MSDAAPAPGQRSRWGHDPRDPRLALLRSSPRMLDFFGEAIKQSGSLYYDRRKFAADLQFVRRSRAKGSSATRGRFACRTRRSERREAWTLVMRAALYRMDLLSLRVGAIAPDGTCRGIPRATLRAYTGLSRWRLERALADLADAGFLDSQQPRELTAGEWRGLPAIRRISPSYFHRIGMTFRLGLERKRAYQRKRDQQRQEAAAAASSPAPAVRRVVAGRPGPRPERDEETQRRLLRFQAEVLRENATRAVPWTPDELRAEALRRLRAPPDLPRPLRT